MKHRLIALLASSAVAAVAVVAPVGAYSIFGVSTGGCTGDGHSYIVTSNWAFTETDASSYGGCGYVFSQGTFIYNNQAHQLGPGWGTGPLRGVDVFENVTDIAGVHNLCNVGGPCGSSNPWGTGD